MKTRLLIIILIAAVIITAIVLLGTTSEIAIGQKYQYKFWQEELEFENNQRYSRVLFSYSHDYGNSFSEPQDVSMTEQNAHEPKMIVMDDDVILVWRDEVEDDTIPNLSFAKSTDFGETFEKKRLDFGARPDIVHYDDVLHITWADLENRKVLYSSTDDRMEIFTEPIVVFAPKGEFSPYADKPTPKFTIDDGVVKIKWSMQDEDYEYVIGEDPSEFVYEEDTGFDSNIYYEEFGTGSPLIYKETNKPVLDEANCDRYAYWMTEHQKEKIDLYEDYPRYPPWGNQIFPLVDYCTSIGNLEKTVVDDKIQWEFYGIDSEINRSCMTLEHSKDIAPFFKVPSYLPEGYSMKCSQSGMPSESYIIYHDKDVSGGWMVRLHMLIDDGAIFIYQYDEKNLKEFETYGSPEQRIQETYDDVMVKNPSLQPQLVRINGMLAFAVDSCPDCGIQTANFTDGTFIQKSTSTETKIKFYDEYGISYMLKTTLSLDELILVAESLR